MWRVTRTGSPEVLRVSESSSDSAETSFRELDVVFLQTQTRIWLGEVLHVRFDEDVGITDLLADGELLFQVSKEVWKMLLRKHGELKYSKMHIYERTSSGKSEDVVEKRDIRKVCMCIRSLSKKARSKNLNVPDFDIVTYTIAMPTHLVGGIRRNLELSWCIPSSFSTSSLWNDAREICGIKIPFGKHSQHSDSRSDEFERNINDLEFESPVSSASYDSTNITYIVVETSPDLFLIADDFVHETIFYNHIKDTNHYEVMHEHQKEMFAESAYSCHLSTTETCAFQNLSSSSYSEDPTDEGTSICFSDIDMWSSDSIPKVVKNGLKAEDLAGTLYVETSYQTYMNASSLNVAPSENNQYFQSSSPYTFSHLEVHSNVEVEPCNTRQESSVFKNAIASNNTAMRNGFYHTEKSDVGNSVMPKSYSLDTEADGNYGNTPSEVKSPSILNLNSLDNFVCDSVLKGSYSAIVSRNVHSFFSSFTDKQNKFSQNLVGHSSDRNQNEPSHSILSSLETDCALLSESDDPNNLAKRGCGSQRTNPLIFSLTESEFECSSSSSMCLMFNDVNVEDGSYLATNNCMQENDVHKANFMTDLNEDFINALVPVVQEDVDVTAYSLSLEEGKFCNDTSYSSFEGQFTSRSLSSGTEVRSNIENAASYQSCQTQENLQVVVEGSLSEEPCPCYNFHMPDSVSEDKIKKCASKLIENQGSSSYYTQGKDDGCICTLMLNGSSISGLPCIVSTLCAQQKSPEKEDSVEHTDGLFYDGISFVDDSDCSELKMYQSSHDASDIAFLLSDYESKIPPSKKGRAMNVADDESSLNPKICQYDDGKMRDFGHQMTKNVSLFYAKKLEVLDVMKSSHFDSSACASEMTHNLEFFHYGLFQSHRNFFETRGETLKTVDILPSSSWACGEGKEVASDESIEVEKHVVSYIHDASVEPNNVPQAILDNTIFQKDTIMLDECGKNKDRQGRTVGKAKNQVLKSAAGVMTMVGVFVFFLHVSQKKDKEKKNEMGMSFLIQKPNEEFFTKRKIKIGKSDSLYPGEKLKL